jgi:hypothetical protein
LFPHPLPHPDVEGLKFMAGVIVGGGPKSIVISTAILTGMGYRGSMAWTRPDTWKVLGFISTAASIESKTVFVI